MFVKICGITTKSALDAAMCSGADFVGFVFAKSTREISLEKAKELSKFVPQNIKKVGVFVDEPLENLLKIAKDVPLDIVQLHGNESSEYAAQIPLETIKVIKIISDKFSQNIEDFANSMLMFDAKISGGGEKFNWKAIDLNKIKERKFFIAGGLDCENVKSAIEYFSPFAVDVSSGVETCGRKDNEKIRKFIKIAKNK
ncbi:MAG: phosphoribosylanthranilate isomerase [Chitinispirillales bacterium]|jgi:phosphoribosylanthranilate isomerase|nr:phosphoribosylanthranilate isomerase [Chitinispirillales bacterium]